MGRVSLPPPVCDSNLSQRVSFESSNNNNNNNVREASFSSYLNHAEREFVRKLAESTRDRSNSKEKDGDIEVFGAEKYFNSGNEIQNTIKLISKQGTSSVVGSEASWNSQNSLLQKVNRDSLKSTKKKKSSQLVKGLLYKIYCCDKKSVEIGVDIVEKSNSKQKQPPPPKTGVNFSFQSSIPDHRTAKKSTLKMEIQKGRESIEVLRSIGKPPSVENLNLNNLEKRISLIAWNDILPRIEDSNKFYNDDVESDTSSDLFEIENLTGNLTRQGGSDPIDCVTPSSCYAPSEASIDWSVITASAVDYSVVSDYDEWRIATTSPIKSSYGIQRSRSNQPMARDKYDPLMEVHRRAETFERLARLESETKIMGFGSNYRPAISRNRNNY